MISISIMFLITGILGLAFGIYAAYKADEMVEEVKMANDAISEMLEERAKDAHKIEDLEEYIDVLKDDLKSAGGMLKKEVVIKKVELEFDPQERIYILQGLEKLAVDSDNIDEMDRIIKLIRKSTNVFIEALEVEDADERNNKASRR